MSNTQQGSKKLYNLTQIVNWSRKEEQEHKVCCRCGKWGAIALKEKYGNYYFLCADHWQEDPSYMDQ